MAELSVLAVEQNGPRCQFQVLRDKNPETGILLLKKKLYDCGKPAGRYRCEGHLTSLEMNLCDTHKNKVVSDYKWNAVKIQDLVNG